MAKILLVEDSEGDAILVGRALARVNAATQNHPEVTHTLCRNGKQALDFLCAPDAMLPDVILLDLRMPVMDGFELLSHLKTFDKLRRIPVIVLSTSDHPNDKSRAIESGARAYLVKPTSASAFDSMLVSFVKFWLEHNHA